MQHMVTMFPAIVAVASLVMSRLALLVVNVEPDPKVTICDALIGFVRLMSSSSLRLLEKAAHHRTERCPRGRNLTSPN